MDVIDVKDGRERERFVDVVKARTAGSDGSMRNFGGSIEFAWACARTRAFSAASAKQSGRTAWWGLGVLELCPCRSSSKAKLLLQLNLNADCPPFILNMNTFTLEYLDSVFAPELD